MVKSGEATGWTSEESWLIPGRGRGDLPSPKYLDQQRCPQPLIKWVPEMLYLIIKQLESKARH
jgi:hypothetical protein